MIAVKAKHLDDRRVILFSKPSIKPASRSVLPAHDIPVVVFMIESEEAFVLFSATNTFSAIHVECGLPVLIKPALRNVRLGRSPFI